MKPKKTTESEKYLMEILWSSEENLSVGNLHDIVFENKAWTLSTIRTLLMRLIEKGYVEKSGKYFLPKFTPEEYRMKETETFLQEVHDNSITNLMTALTGKASLTNEELEELQGWLDQQKGRGR